MPVSQAQPIPTKLALRRTLKAQRHGRNPAERDQASRALAAVALELPRLRRAECVTVYASLPEEPGTALLRTGLRELGIRVLLPIVGDDPEGHRLDWAEDTGELAPAGALQLPEPTGQRFGPAEIGQAQVVLVPALAVDTTGTRLGRGGGYYDAALTHTDPEALVLALVHDSEVLDAATTPIPREKHDVGVHGVITPTRWIFLNSVRG